MNRSRRPARALVLAVVLGALVVLLGGVIGGGSGAVAPWRAEPAAAQGSGERIRRYTVDVVVAADGSAEFREVIEYDFGPNERHGIERFVPTRMGFDDQQDRLYPLRVISVSSPTAPSQFTVSPMARGLERIRIGDPDRTIRGVHTYTLQYRLDGVVNAQDGDDELYWNVIGDAWDVPIAGVAVRVVVPDGARRIACFAGTTRSDAPCASSTVQAGVATFAQPSLGANQGLTVVVAIPDADGPVAEPRFVLGPHDADPGVRSFDEMFARTPATIGVTALLAVAFAAVIAPLQFLVGRDRRGAGTVTDVAFSEQVAEGERVPLFDRTATPVEFVPPDDLRPAQLGVLRDEVADTRDVSATIIDLAVRGRLRIEEVTDSRGKVTDYRLVELDTADERPALLEYERHLLGRLFASSSEVLLSSLKNEFATAMKRTKELLYIDAVARGWFLTRPDRVRMWWAFGGLALALAGAGLTFVLAGATSWGLVGLPVAVAGLVVLVGSRWMPRRTPKGTGVLRRTKGFEDFIENSEKHRAAFAERKNLFTEYLPYAVMFGATDKWARTLAVLGLPEPDTSTWYVGHGPIVWASFGDRVDRFSSTAASTLTSTPGSSGSSGFSGGFSGGGGGGGGGGSW
jgi:uncharacterized membrane protein YgcG